MGEGTAPLERSEPWRERFPPISYWVKVGAVIMVLIIAIRILAILQGLLIVLLASAVLAIGLQPAISWLERRGMPRGLALAVIMLAGLALVVAAGFLVVPAVVEQTRELVRTIPDRIEGLEEDSPLIGSILDRLDPAAALGSTMTQVPDGALSAVGGIVSAAIDLILVLTLTPYFALALPRMRRWAVRLLVRRDREEFMHLLNRSTELMANYITGNLVVSLIAGTVAYVGLTVIGVPYAAALAVFVAVTDLVPAVGATVGAIVVVSVAASQGIAQVAWSLLLILGYQQVENFYIVPRVMRDAIDVTPAAGIVALLVGGTLAGPVGALLALPLAAMIKLVMEEFVLSERIAQVRAADAEDEQSRSGRGRRRTVRRLP